jgi:GTP cyclohydrolase I
MTTSFEPAGSIVPNGNGRAKVYVNGHAVTGNGRNGHVHGAIDARGAAGLAGMQAFTAAPDRLGIEAAVRQILFAVGEDPERDGLSGTPDRVARMYGEILEGYTQDLKTVINGALFDVEYDEGEMITVADIPFTSLCEHHMLPFAGTAHVAYVPRGKVVGLSKIPRVVDMFAKRLQVQERLTNEIADALGAALDPLGIMVVVEGQHSCAALRGVKKHGVNMITTAKRGVFKSDRGLCDDFYRQIGR